MINILLSDYDFGEGALYDSLSEFIRPNMKVATVPFSHSNKKMPTVEEYNKYCNKGGIYYQLIEEQFCKLGILSDNINVIHYYWDAHKTMIDKIHDSDILFLTGGLPDKAVDRIIAKELYREIKKFNGIIMGASAGALMQLNEYFCTPDKDYDYFDFYKGLGLIDDDIYVEVHYEGADLLKDFPELRERKNSYLRYQKEWD
jgi:hypothetical protein